MSAAPALAGWQGTARSLRPCSSKTEAYHRFEAPHRVLRTSIEKKANTTMSQMQKYSSAEGSPAVLIPDGLVSRLGKSGFGWSCACIPRHHPHRMQNAQAFRRPMRQVGSAQLLLKQNRPRAVVREFVEQASASSREHCMCQHCDRPPLRCRSAMSNSPSLTVASSIDSGLTPQPTGCARAAGVELVAGPAGIAVAVRTSFP